MGTIATVLQGRFYAGTGGTSPKMLTNLQIFETIWRWGDTNAHNVLYSRMDEYKRCGLGTQKIRLELSLLFCRLDDDDGVRE